MPDKVFCASYGQIPSGNTVCVVVVVVWGFPGRCQLASPASTSHQRVSPASPIPSPPPPPQQLSAAVVASSGSELRTATPLLEFKTFPVAEILTVDDGILGAEVAATDEQDK